MKISSLGVAATISAVLLTSLVSHPAETFAQSTSIITSDVGDEVASVLDESTYFDGYEDSSSDLELADPNDSMARIDAISETLPATANTSNAVLIDPITEVEAPDRTFTILGGLGLGSEVERPDPTFVLTERDLSQYAISLATGRRHRSWLRSETEFAFRREEDNVRFDRFSSLFSEDSFSSFGNTVAFSGEINIASLMKNVILQWNNSTRLTPYGGVGVGVSYIDFRANGNVLSRYFFLEGSDTVFSLSLIHI